MDDLRLRPIGPRFHLRVRPENNEWVVMEVGRSPEPWPPPNYRWLTPKQKSAERARRRALAPCRAVARFQNEWDALKYAQSLLYARTHCCARK
jgi:hypothetical protein